jgi:hypothetical protein
MFKVIKDQDRSIVRQLVEDFSHEGQSISFTGREWQIDILNDMRPNCVCRKPSQKGLTWVLERFTMALLMRYSERPYVFHDHMGNERSRFVEAIYSFESEKKASNWSKVRLAKIKNDNPHIRDSLKIGQTDSTLLMKLGRTALHLVGRGRIGGVLSISADLVVVDEKDRDENPSISTQIGSRLLESSFMNTESTKGLLRTTSTPEVSGAGISLLYENSTQCEFEIYCENCCTWQVLRYPDCIGNFYERGEDPPVDDQGRVLAPYWRCQSCYRAIDWTTIGQWSSDDPDYYKNCRWRAAKPEKYNEKTGSGIIGYQVPFAGPDRSAAYLLSERDDPEHDISYLYNHLLGFPYDDVSKTLVASNFHIRHDAKWGYSGAGTYVMGCDHHPSQGGFITIWKLLEGSKSVSRPEGKWVCVYVEHVKSNTDLWDTTESMDDREVIKKGRLYELIHEFNIELAVCDIEPDTNAVEQLIAEFGFTKTVWGNKSGTPQDTFKIVEEEIVDDEVVPVCKVYEHKIAAIDWYFNMIRFGNVSFLTDLEYTQDRLMKDFIKSHLNLYKSEIEVKKGGFAEKTAAQNVKEVYKKKVASVGDHWVMSSKFAAQATRILVLANRGIGKIVPPSIQTMGRIPGL